MNEGAVKKAENPMQACMGMMEEMSEGTDKGICPMASMCKGMMERPGFWFLPIIAGAVLIIGGVLIFIEPRILLWLIAVTFIIAGIMMSGFAIFIRRHAH